MSIDDILNYFNEYNSLLQIKAIYNAPNGYLIIASEIKNEIDYNDPNYIMDEHGNVEEYPMANIDEFFNIIQNEPIYISD